MSTLDPKFKLEFTGQMTLTEGEMRALDALVGYGDDAFLKAFYVKLGRHYMQPFEKDMRDLFKKIRVEVLPTLREIQDTRKRITEAARKP